MTGTNAAADVSQRVSAGAELLDRQFPGWAEKLDTGRLRIASCRHCVLGQLFGDFFQGLRAVKGEAASDPRRFGFDGWDWSTPDYGKDSEALTAEWRRVVAERRRAS